MYYTNNTFNYIWYIYVYAGSQCRFVMTFTNILENGQTEYSIYAYHLKE